jgi:hypothetical protein
MAMAANIACVICGARPYPDLGPTGTREDFDLLKLVEREIDYGKIIWAPAGDTEGEWFCSLHRRGGPPGPSGEPTYLIVKPTDLSEPITTPPATGGLRL